MPNSMMFYNYPHYFFIKTWGYRNGITQNRLGLYKKARESLIELYHLMIVAKNFPEPCARNKTEN